MTSDQTRAEALELAPRIAERLTARNEVSRRFFPSEAPRLAETSSEMAARFLEGGRLLAFGRGSYATDAQHISVEFVHPVIVGKRALPALDLSLAFESWIRTVIQPKDIVVGFVPAGGDAVVESVLAEMFAKGNLTLALSEGLTHPSAHYAPAAPSDDPFIHQEMIEVLYHTLWETVHVFFEHRELGHEVGEAGFLYPFLGQDKQDTGPVVDQVAASILVKAQEDERLRAEVAKSSAARIAEAAVAISERIASGGRLICFGNGGSATDANDFALDCVMPPEALGFDPLPAISLSLEPANLSAIANDVGEEAIFLRQLIAQAGPRDVAVAFSTSGGSANIMAALAEARKRDMLTVAFLGYDGGEIVRRDLADIALVVRCDYIPRIQEIHASIYHVLREMLPVTVHGRA